MRLTREQVEEYDREGYLFFPALFTPDEVRVLNAEVPKLYAEIERPESVDVTATNEKGEALAFRCGGLLARCIQHETDHLNGILFIDRMSRADREELKPDLEDLQAETKAALKSRK